jgi:tetratricopeptide (TPR) repeat protein
LALVQHLRGDLKEADQLYCKAEVPLRERPGGNPRALSIFLRHHGDLKMALGDMDGAKEFILESRALAEAERYPELVAYARVSLGHWYRVKTQYPQALHEYNAALSESRRIGIRRLESEALSELSRLACDLGDAQTARQRATDALRIANESSLGLRQTHCLVVLGRATVLAGDHSLGIAYLKHAQTLAKRQEYWLRGGEADEQLQQLGADQ